MASPCSSHRFELASPLQGEIAQKREVLSEGWVGLTSRSGLDTCWFWTSFKGKQPVWTWSGWLIACVPFQWGFITFGEAPTRLIGRAYWAIQVSNLEHSKGLLAGNRSSASRRGKARGALPWEAVLECVFGGYPFCCLKEKTRRKPPRRICFI